MPGGGDLRRDKWLIGTTLVLHRTSNPAMPLSGSEQALGASRHAHAHQPFSSVKSVSIHIVLIIHGHSGGGTTLK